MACAARRTDCVYKWSSVLLATRAIHVKKYERCARVFMWVTNNVHDESADYGGISASRLEVLEERLRDDVISELNQFGGRCVGCSILPAHRKNAADVCLVDSCCTRKHLMVLLSLFGKRYRVRMFVC